ncbi:alpha-galactosidase, partial [bacterium]|nr:alpha-galactosidase [bacterium]
MPRSDTTQSSDIGNGWRLIPHENSVSLYVPGRVSLIHCRTALVLPDGAKLDPTAAEVTNTPARIQVVFSYEKKISVLHNIGSGPCDGFIHITTQLTNKGEEDLPLDSMRILESQTIEAIPTLDRVLAHGTTMASFAGLQPLGPHFNSHTVIGLTNQRGAGALVLGFLKPDDAMYEAHAQTGPLAVLGLSGVVRREGIALNAGRTLEPSPYCLGWGDELAALMDAYARESGRAMNAITPAGPEDTMTGWCSWYRYYGFETQEAILENTRILAESPLRKHIKVIQIDDGWNLPEPGVPRHWGDWTPGAKFPQGMKHVADEIHSLDFKAGLWLAPFSVAPESNLAQDHADWLLQKSEKRSDLDVFVNPGGIYGLDLTHPEVLSFLKETFHRVFHEWGYDYIKIDFLGHSMAETRRYDPTKTSAQAFRMGLGAIRDAAG